MAEADLSDSAGIAKELAQEAAQDIGATARSAADKISETAAIVADRATSTARAAYNHPTEFAEFSFRSMKRFTRERPLDAIAIAAGVAFVFGALTQLGRR